MSANPFRNHPVSPSHTGPQTIYQPPPGPPPSHVTSANSSPPLPPIPDDDLGGDLNEELPPAYTFQPDTAQGEETLDVGPRRPFQPVESRPQPITTTHTNPQSQHLNNNNSQSHSWSAYPGQQQQHRPLLSPQWSSASSIPPPPPRHPYSASRQNSASISAPDLQATAISDFAREFYAAGADVRIPGWPGTDNEPSGSSSATSPASPHSLTSPTIYQPPPGMPPSSPSPSSSRTNEIPDDGRPTRTPVPGHPLLHNGKMLVYPGGYTCRRCENTGYMGFDPSNPCTKCWGRHARPYAGALAYAPTASNPAPAGPTPVANSIASNWQRPLPRKNTPITKSKSHNTLQSSHKRSVSSPQGAPAPSASRAAAVANNRAALGLDNPSRLTPTSIGRAPSIIQTNSDRRLFDRNAVVLPPGDPRLGGWLCYNCSGDGQEISLSGLLFGGGSRCRVCSGTGRIY